MSERRTAPMGFLTVPRAAARCNVGKQRIYDAISSGALAPHPHRCPVSGHYVQVLDRDAVDAWNLQRLLKRPSLFCPIAPAVHA